MADVLGLSPGEIRHRINEDELVPWAFTREGERDRAADLSDPDDPGLHRLPIKGLAVHKHSLPVPRRRNRLPGEELVHDAVRLLPFGPLFEDVDRSDLGDVLQMRTAAGAVVRTPDFDDPQAAHGLRDEIQEGSIVDFVVDDDAV